MRQHDTPVNTKFSVRTHNQQGLNIKLPQSFSSVVVLLINNIRRKNEQL